MASVRSKGDQVLSTNRLGHVCMLEMLAISTDPVSGPALLNPYHQAVALAQLHSSGGEVKVSGGILPLQLTYLAHSGVSKLSITVEIAQRELPKIILQRPASSASWQGRQPLTWSCRRCTAPHAT
jgi:hypothetical protein